MDLNQYLERMNTNTKIIWIQQTVLSVILFLYLLEIDGKLKRIGWDYLSITFLYFIFNHLFFIQAYSFNFYISTYIITSPPFHFRFLQGPLFIHLFFIATFCLLINWVWLIIDLQINPQPISCYYFTFYSSYYMPSLLGLRPRPLLFCLTLLFHTFILIIS